MNRKQILIIFACSVSIILTIACGAVFYQIGMNIQRAESEEQAVLLELSKRIGVEANWPSIREYLYCDALKEGMNQQEVTEVLLSIGSSNWNSNGDTNKIELNTSVEFNDPYISQALSPLYLFFSSKGHLNSWTASETNFGPRAACE